MEGKFYMVDNNGSYMPIGSIEPMEIEPDPEDLKDVPTIGGFGSESMTLNFKLSEEAIDAFYKAMGLLRRYRFNNNWLKLHHAPMIRFSVYKRQHRAKRRQVKQGKFRNKRHCYT